MKLTLKLFLLAMVAFGVYAGNSNEVNTVLKNGRLAVAADGVLKTTDGNTIKIDKGSYIIRSGPKCVYKSKLYQADSKTTPYLENYYRQIKEEYHRVKNQYQMLQTKVNSSFKKYRNSLNDGSSEKLQDQYQKSYTDECNKRNNLKSKYQELQNRLNDLGRQLGKKSSKLSELRKNSR